MSRMRGLEMIAIGREKAFPIEYSGGGNYLDPSGKPVPGILDMICFNCGAAYFTLDDQPIEFCPACGQFERRRFESRREIEEWANKQSWKFLRFSGNSVFSATRGDGWFLAFARDRGTLEMRGIFEDLNLIYAP